MSKINFKKYYLYIFSSKTTFWKVIVTLIPSRLKMLSDAAKTRYTLNEFFCLNFYF